MRVKMNISNVMNKALEIIAKSKSKLALEDGFGVQIGFEIFVEYLKDISNRAIKIDDPIILECLLDTGIISADEEETKSIREKSKQIKGE